MAFGGSVVMVLALSACSDDVDRAAAPAQESTTATTASTPAASAAGSENDGGFFIDGTRLCVTNKTTQPMSAKARNAQEASQNTQLAPGDEYCAAGYQEGISTRENGDIVIDVQATNADGASANLVMLGNNQVGVSGVDARTLDGGIPRHLVTNGTLAVGKSISGTTLDQGLKITMTRVDDCCGWKQLRATVSEVNANQ